MDKMQAWFVLLLVGCAFANGEEVVTLSYDDPILDDPVTMDVHINHEEETIHFHMEEQGGFADVETFEDYQTGFAASRVEAEKSCYIRKLVIPMEEAVEKAKQLSKSEPLKKMDDEDLFAIPVDDDLEEFAGKKIVDFCSGYETYKLAKAKEEGAELLGPNEVAALDKDKRQSTVVFRICKIFFFIFICFTTTITVPTGTTIIFFFFG